MIRRTLFLLLLSTLTLFAFLFLDSSRIKNNSSTDALPKIKLTTEMVINESALGDAWKLVDEQENVGDPAAGKGLKPSTNWEIDWNKKDYYPISAVIDLGRNFELSHIYLFDGAGEGELIISTGIPFEWQPQIVENLKRYNEWIKHPINIKTRFLQIKYFSRLSMPEIIIYGSPVDEREYPNKPTLTNTIDKPTMDEFIGINAFIDDPIEKIKVAGFVREYHVWDWDEGNGQPYVGYPKNENAFNPSYPSNKWLFDDYYKKLKEEGITVVTCIQSCPKWLCENDNEKPLKPGLDPESPFSYKEHADHFFQVAARYGNERVADSLLKLADNQAKHSGLGILKYYENWNEPDKDWATRKEYFSPFEFAAMASADYDGHMGALGDTYGIKNADPNAKLVMGGITSLNLDYIISIVFWSKYNRNGNVPFDVINVHHYSNDAGKQRGLGKIGISPESDSIKQRMEAFIKFRNAYLPDKEVWITEFGYDTHPKSIQKAPAIGQMSQEEVQGIWLVRSYLALAAAGVDKAAMYMLRDTENSHSGVQFSASGLTKNKNTNHAPKPSWYFVYTLKTALKGMIYMEDISTKDAHIYKFQEKGGNREAYVIWSPTSIDKKIKNFILPIGNTKMASKIELVNGKAHGLRKPLSVKDSKVILTVSEKPQIILVDPY